MAAAGIEYRITVSDSDEGSSYRVILKRDRPRKVYAPKMYATHGSSLLLPGYPRDSQSPVLPARLSPMEVNIYKRCKQREWDNFP